MNQEKDLSIEEKWMETKNVLPENQLVVETKIVDGKGERNVQQLKRRNSLWFFPDGSMYVYYTPTHWRLIPDTTKHNQP